MTPQMGNITELAWKVLIDDELLMSKYSSPEAVLDYLRNEANFKSLSLQLKEVMIRTGFCKENAAASDFTDTLYNCLLNQSAQCSCEAKPKNTIRRWLNGDVKAIRRRSDVIEICFALSLTYDMSTELLNKCGHNGFNIRNAEDAVYIYCLINHRPLIAANNLLDSYANAIADEPDDFDKETFHSGQTTIHLENTLFANCNWDSDSEFLTTFLIPNKSKFKGYSNTAIREYYALKNSLFITVFIDISSMEQHLVFERLEEGLSYVDQSDIPISLAFRSALRKHDSPGSILYPFNKMLKEDMTNTADTMAELRKKIESCSDILIQKEISIFLSDIMTIEGFLKYVVSSIRSENYRIRKYRESNLKDSVMKEFPDDKSFANFEKAPSKTSQSMTLRKAIILMYYIAYSYEFSLTLLDYRYVSMRFKELGFMEFMEDLNSLLHKCKLAPLYPANQFDWLILRSIRQFEVFDTFEDDETPVTFFNDVLAFSFDSHLVKEE